MVNVNDSILAKNTVYFKAFNDDYRIGGIYHNLDSSEFRMIIILQAYSDNQGYVRNVNGNGYKTTELTEMIGMNYRTLKMCLIGLSEKGLITINDDSVIQITHFVVDNVYRSQKSDKSTRASQMIAAQTAENRKILQDIHRNTRKKVVVISEQTGQILNKEGE
jgi:hypothetical protein